MGFDLQRFSGADAVRLSTDLRKLGAIASDLEHVASRTTQLLYTDLLDAQTTEPACALVRFYVLTRFGRLDEERRTFATNRAGDEKLSDATPCLALLGTSGQEPAWNARATSVRHQAIPLPDKDQLHRFPMVLALFTALGVDTGALFQGSSDIGVSLNDGKIGVFYVPEARGSAAIPGQAFVETYGVRSVLGFGGTLPAGELFVVLIFAKVSIERDVSEHFKTVALGTKLASLRASSRGQSSVGVRPEGLSNAAEAQFALLIERLSTMEQLLDDQENLATAQSDRVAKLVEELNLKLIAERERAEALAQMHLTIEALSTPIIEVWDDILVMPLVGGIDTQRATQIMERLLHEVSQRGCRFVILDVTGVDTIDTAIADSLIGIVSAVGLLGAECVLTGMKPSVSQTLVTLGVDLGKLRTLRNLKHALKAFLKPKRG